MITRLQSLISAHERVYVDSNTLIYYIEDSGQLSGLAAECLDYCVAQGIRLVTSELSLTECLWGVYKTKREGLADLYRKWLFDDTLVELSAVEIHVLEMAATIGPSHNLRLADAIHVASAMLTECSAMLTNDKRLRLPESIQPIRLTDVH